MPRLPLNFSDPPLVILFGPPRLLDTPDPIQSVLAAYPGTAAIRGSGSGEISWTHTQDHTLAVGLLRFDRTTGHSDLHNQTMTLTTISEAA